MLSVGFLGDKCVTLLLLALMQHDGLRRPGCRTRV